jgi:hypothetical protein
MITVLEFSHVKNGNAHWKCKCDCGTIKSIQGNHLKSKSIVSCGCYNKNKGIKHGFRYTRIYRIWGGMLSRCNRPANDNYMHYGGRGIKVCDAWKDFIPFKDWALANGYKDCLTIDRIQVNGNYEPNNCRWATQKEQGANKRSREIKT